MSLTRRGLLMGSELGFVAEDNPELRNSVLEACRFLSDIGHVIGTWGNVSVRLKAGILITPSRIEYSRMRPDDLVVVSWDGTKLKGSRVPSSETELHRQLLMKRSDFGALVHTHSPYASVLCCARRSMPVFVEDVAQIIGGEVRCTRYVPGGRHTVLAEEACEVIGDKSNAVLLANHGPVVGGRNLAEALVAAQVLEKAAMLFVNATVIGGYRAIPDKSVAEERYRFLYKYGKPEDLLE